MTTTAIERTQAETALASRDPTNLGPILVASDGSDASTAALRAGALLEQRTGAEVVVLAVLEGLPVVAADFGMIVPPIESSDARRSSLMERVRNQVTEIAARAREWKIEVRDGDPSQTIARTARELKARVITIGLGHHQLLDRLFGGETALHVLRQARTPVLAVPADFDTLPERLLIAMDFSPDSINAGRIAVQLFDTVTSVHVVHVAPKLELQPDAFAAWMTMFREGVGPGFERVRQELALPANVSYETETLPGKPSRELLEFADRNGMDLIVTGSSGAGVVDRILVGSTATGILRGAKCAVLAVPASGEDRQTWRTLGEGSTVARDDWASALETFTRQNQGRLASLEVDDPEFGAQAQERDYPFLGASWDHNDERIQIMLGDFQATGRHLTRGIGGVTGVDIIKDQAGRDRLLRIKHGDGQTILTLTR